MRKILVLFSVVIAIIAVIVFNYMSYQKQYSDTIKYNLEFQANYQKEIYGIDLTTIINKVINNNEKNNVEIGNDSKYISNETDSINIDIKIIDNNEIYSMETLYSGGIERFVQYYGNIQFKCTQIEYHKKTGKVSYMFFEQISE